MKKLVLFFPVLWDGIHLKKDVGLFPVYLKKYFDEVEIIYCYEKGYDHLPTEYRGIKLKVIGNINKYQRGRLWLLQTEYFHWKVYNYVKSNPSITHLMFFHWSFQKLKLFSRIKSIRPNIKIYLKMDCSIIGAQNITDKYSNKINGVKGLLLNNLIEKGMDSVDLITTETTRTYQILGRNPFFKGKLHIAFNGYDDNLYYKPEILKKDKTIITVGRLGTVPKNTELFLEIIKSLDLKDWKIKLIGPIEKNEKDFQNDIDQFYSERPDLQGKVVFTGPINDSEKLIDEYQKASVFVLTSRWESSALVLLEAAINGCYLCSTDVGVAEDLKYCWVCPESKQNNQNQLVMLDSFAQKLQQLIDNQNLCFENFDKRNDYYHNNLMMSKIVGLECFQEWAR